MNLKGSAYLNVLNYAPAKVAYKVLAKYYAEFSKILLPKIIIHFKVKV